jgi:hypothetical protein
MKQQTLTPKMERRRKMLLVLPLLVLPFLTLFFWALGGGKGNAADARVTTQKGFNNRLPDAKLKDNTALNKMSYYDKAALDSDKLRQQMKSDPYYRQRPDTDTASLHFPKTLPVGKIFASANINRSKLMGTHELAADEANVYQKLAALQTVISKPAVSPDNAAVKESVKEPASPLKIATEPEDPQLKQMNGLLEKILDIQHPERLRDKAGQSTDTASKRFRAIPAVIDGNQKITQGSVVRIRLLDTITLNGQLIPKGQLLYGSGTFYNQRYAMNLKILHIGYSILPIDLTVYDMTDGLEGISVPEAITEDAVKDGAVSGVQGMEFMSLDASITTQLAGAGLNTAKGLLSKKVKRIKAKLKDGHLLLLRDNIRLRQVKSK